MASSLQGAIKRVEQRGILSVMIIRKDIGYAILGGIGFLSITGLLGATWVSANFTAIMEDQLKQAEMIRIKGAAELYHRRLQSYRGVCTDVGVPPFYSCNDSETAYAVSVERDNGLFYCADSTGHFGEEILPIRTNRTCTQ